MSFAVPADYNMLPSAAQVPDWSGPRHTYGTCKILIEAVSVAPWISTLIVAIIAITIAWFVNTDRMLNKPDQKGFLWGYFIAFSGGLDGVWLIATHLRLAACLQPGANLLVAMYGTALIFFSYAAYRRTKIGWIGASALSLNPIWWVINYFYARKRWDEFGNTIPLPSTFAFWRPLQVRLKLQRFKEQQKLLYQNPTAAGYLADYFAANRPEEGEVIKLCKDAQETARVLAIKASSATYLDMTDLERLRADNREARRLYAFTPTSHVQSFDSVFQPILGWERHYERKTEDIAPIQEPSRLCPSDIQGKIRHRHRNIKKRRAALQESIGSEHNSA